MNTYVIETCTGGHHTVKADRCEVEGNQVKLYQNHMLVAIFTNPVSVKMQQEGDSQ